jgi:general secretion pathway protein K
MMMAWRPRDTNPLANERGVALVITLLIVTLVAVVVLDVNYLMRVDVHAAANFRDGMRSYYMAKSGVSLTQELFSRNLQEFEELKNTLLLGGTHTLPMGDGSVTIRVVDETGKINVNALTLEAVPNQATAPAQPRQGPNEPPPVSPWIQITQDLFQRLGVDPILVGALIDWIDIDDIPTGAGGAEGHYYRSLEKPYTARNGPMETIGEMRLVRGFTDEVWLKLGAKRIGGVVDPATNLYLTVLPASQGGWKVNLNTAPVLILNSLTREVGQFAEAIVRRRTQARIDKMTDLQQLGISGEAVQDFQRLGTLQPVFCSVQAHGTVGEMEKQITALLRVGSGDQAGKILYWRVL